MTDKIDLMQGAPEFMKKLLSGEEKPANDMAAYLVELLQEEMIQAQNVVNRMQALRAEARKLGEQEISLQASLKTHIRDLHHWQYEQAEKEGPL